MDARAEATSSNPREIDPATIETLTQCARQLAFNRLDIYLLTTPLLPMIQKAELIIALIQQNNYSLSPALIISHNKLCTKLSIYHAFVTNDIEKAKTYINNPIFKPALQERYECFNSSNQLEVQRSDLECLETMSIYYYVLMLDKDPLDQLLLEAFLQKLENQYGWLEEKAKKHPDTSSSSEAGLSILDRIILGKLLAIRCISQIRYRNSINIHDRDKKNKVLALALKKMDESVALLQKYSQLTVSYPLSILESAETNHQMGLIFMELHNNSGAQLTIRDAIFQWETYKFLGRRFSVNPIRFSQFMNTYILVLHLMDRHEDALNFLKVTAKNQIDYRNPEHYFVMAERYYLLGETYNYLGEMTHSNHYFKEFLKLLTNFNASQLENIKAKDKIMQIFPYIFEEQDTYVETQWGEVNARKQYDDNLQLLKVITTIFIQLIGNFPDIYDIILMTEYYLKLAGYYHCINADAEIILGYSRLAANTVKMLTLDNQDSAKAINNYAKVLWHLSNPIDDPNVIFTQLEAYWRNRESNSETAAEFYNSFGDYLTHLYSTTKDVSTLLKAFEQFKIAYDIYYVLQIDNSPNEQIAIAQQALYTKAQNTQDLLTNATLTPRSHQRFLQAKMPFSANQLPLEADTPPEAKQVPKI